MNILLSNDDGFDSPGILKLQDKLLSDGHDAVIVAPHRERSTAGHSLTLHKPLRVHRASDKIYAVSGSPADCVYMALRKILPKKPDLVISGINRGANLGHDIFYSGTVAAAREGYLYGIPAIAVSLTIGFPNRHDHHSVQPNWNTAVEFMSHLVKMIPKTPELSGMFFLNVNVPDISRDKLAGTKFARQGRRLYSDEIIENHDPRNKPYYWIGGGPVGYDKNPESDCVEVAENFIAVTPLKVDTTDDVIKAKLEKSVNIDWR